MNFPRICENLTFSCDKKYSGNLTTTRVWLVYENWTHFSQNFSSSMFFGLNITLSLNKQFEFKMKNWRKNLQRNHFSAEFEAFGANLVGSNIKMERLPLCRLTATKKCSVEKLRKRLTSREKRNWDETASALHIPTGNWYTRTWEVQLLEFSYFILGAIQPKRLGCTI